MCHLRGTNIRISVTCSTCYRPFSGTWYTYHDDSQVCSQSPGTEKLMGKIQVKIAALIQCFGGGVLVAEEVAPAYSEGAMCIGSRATGTWRLT